MTPNEPDPGRLQRLEAMGIQVWLPRARGTEPAGDPATEPTGEPARVRLSAGTGDWLLVLPATRPRGADPLLADIQALLPAKRLCFGQWADQPRAGSTIEELFDQGIRVLLTLAPPPAGVESGPGITVVGGESLDDLLRDGTARQRLWKALKPVLEP